MRQPPKLVRGPDWWLRLHEAWWRLTIGPEYAPSKADQRNRYAVGLELPSRASVAVLGTTALILLDQGNLIAARLPVDGVAGLTPIAIQRFVLFLLVPLAIVLVGFRDDPRRYGLRLGSWGWGAGLLLVGIAIMTPIILWLSGLDSFRSFYGSSAATLGSRVANNLVELVPAEFLLRGFLMFALWRRIGPLALVVVQIPFVLTHLGKPDVELWSTFVGGSIFAWLNWRTGSILWSALGHVFVLTLMQVAVGGATV